MREAYRYLSRMADRPASVMSLALPTIRSCCSFSRALRAHRLAPKASVKGPAQRSRLSSRKLLHCRIRGHTPAPRAADQEMAEIYDAIANARSLTHYTMTLEAFSHMHVWWPYGALYMA